MKVIEKDVYAFGIVSGVLSIVCGGILLAFFRIFILPYYIKYLGIIWIFFGLLFLIGVYLFKKRKLREGGTLLVVSGLVSFPVGVGFFMGSLGSIITGVLIFKKFEKENDLSKKLKD